MNKAKLALIAASVLAAPVSAKLPSDKVYEVARGIAQGLIGLSPSGADIYARRAAAFDAITEQYDALDRLNMLVGQELAREAPDRARLAELGEAIAQEEASISRRKSKELITTAFQLSPADRRKLGQLIARNDGTPTFP